jgi:acid phosphatase family membrane protein YuiD
MKIIVIAIVASQIAQISKVFTYYFKNKKWEFHRYFQASGMPSAHSAVVASVATSVGVLRGTDSIEFGLSMVLAAIVVYDATNVRYQAGLHAKVLNDIIDDEKMIEYQKKAGVTRPKAELKELIGHTIAEAIVGILLGVVISLTILNYWR